MMKENQSQKMFVFRNDHFKKQHSFEKISKSRQKIVLFIFVYCEYRPLIDLSHF